MLQENYIILTGAMGAGKSTVLNKLKELNFNCVDEPARQILEEQRLINGAGVPEVDPELFAELMLSRTVFQYKLYKGKSDIVFFDRGMPDFIGYADLLSVDKEVFGNASKVFRFNKNVFMFNGREEIYTTDEERKMNFNQADKFGKYVRNIYEEYEYIIHDVPFADIDTRIKFILNKIKNENMF